MPRQQSSSNRSSTPQRPKTYAPPPKIWHSAPPVPSPLSSATAASPGLWQSVKDGIGLGAGSAIGHRIVGGVLGPSSPPPSAPPLSTYQPPPYYASESYTQCLYYNKENPEICRPFMSKDKSPWTLCMEQNFFKADYCSTESSKSR